VLPRCDSLFLYLSTPISAFIRKPFALNAAPAIKGDFLMRLVKVIAALTSVVAAGCSVFAVSWIGLALLGH
jgi:hypothetical protein